MGKLTKRYQNKNNSQLSIHIDKTYIDKVSVKTARIPEPRTMVLLTVGLAVFRFFCKIELPREVATPILQTICYTAVGLMGGLALRCRK